jgi:hypothetical protein
MDPNNAIVYLADIATPLSLYTASMPSLLRIAGLINDANGFWMSMFRGDKLLDVISQSLIVPLNR